MNTVYLTCEKQHISKLGLTANFETASVSNWETTKILLPFLIQSVLSPCRELPRCFQPVLCYCLQKFVIYRILEIGTSVRCSSSRGEKLCHSKSVRHSAAPHPRPPGLMFPNKFKASLFSLFPGAILNKGWVSELCGPVGVFWTNKIHCAQKLTFIENQNKAPGLNLLVCAKNNSGTLGSSQSPTEVRERLCLTDRVEQEGNKESE